MREVRPRAAWHVIAREPLVHFAAIGLMLFAVDAWRGSAREPARSAPPRIVTAAAAPVSRAPIVIDERAQAQIQASAERRLGRAPGAAEIADETERWIDEEVLHREAIERGLDHDDPVIHARIASRMSYVLEQAAIVPDPSEAELRAWFAAHRERWTVPERVDFTHVFLAGDDAGERAAELVAALAAGAAPERLGDRFAGGHRYRGRRPADLARAFGESFASGLEAQAPGAWVERRSRHGLHLVRLDRVEPRRPADFETARLDVRKAWREARLAGEVGAALARIRAGWEVVRP